MEKIPLSSKDFFFFLHPLTVVEEWAGEFIETKGKVESGERNQSMQTDYQRGLRTRARRLRHCGAEEEEGGDGGGVKINGLLFVDP